MKNHKMFLVLIVSLVLITFFSVTHLSKSPLSVFVLKGSDNNNIEAFGLDLFLDHREPVVREVKLGSEAQKLGGEILRSKDKKMLAVYSQNFGKWSAVLGIPGAEEGWPGYLGGGVHGLFLNDPSESFDNLQPSDRFYLSLKTRTPPSLPSVYLEDQPVILNQAPTNTPATVTGIVFTPVPPVRPGVVRVEILNGCGITNAAEWVARRLKGTGITIVGTDNADNFHYAKTIVRSAAGLPVALEEALDRLGLAKDSVEEITNPPASADAVVIVGKDFRKLKERLRERASH
jgi:hypothetical protein